MAIKIIISDKTYSGKTGESIQEILVRLNLKSERVIVEKNGKLLKKESFNKIKLKNKDVVCVARFLAGG
jgi:thiamine biosynthesis protein ThiS